MYKFSTILTAICLTFLSPVLAQKQSIIYDAVTIMNAKYGSNALLIPNSNGYAIHHPITGNLLFEQIEGDDQTGQADSILKNNFTSLRGNDVIYSILKRNAGLPDAASEADVKNAYSRNPFISKYLDTLRILRIDTLMYISKFFFDPSSGGIGGDVFGNLVNGTADFLIKRAQEEISVSVFEKLKQFITRFPEFDTLFPRTCGLIKPVNAYEYNKALQAFKDATREDFKVLIPRISLLYDIPRYKLLNEQVPSLTLVFGASALLGDLHNKSGFAEALYNLEKRSFVSEKNNYASFLKLLTIFSNSLLDQKLADPENITYGYIQREFITKATHNNPTLWRDLAQLYLGLIWQRTATLNFTTATGSKSFGELLEYWSGRRDIDRSLKTVNTILNSIVQADNELGEIKKQEVGDAQITGKLEIRVKRFTIYSNLLSQLLGVSELYIDPVNTTFSSRIQEIRQYLPEFTNRIMTMIKDFQQEEYSLGLSKLAEVLKTTSDYLEELEKNKKHSKEFSTVLSAALLTKKSELETKKTALERRMAALPQSVGDALLNVNIDAEKQELRSTIKQIEAELEQISYQEKNKSTVIFKLTKVMEYVNLLAAVTKAENSNAIESLLESYALPAGSSRVKKLSAFNIALNAYVGGFFGRSGIEGEGFTNTYGLTAPIGFTFSKGFQRGGSVSLFTGVFDIGGTVRYKLDNQGKYQQDISLAGIVSPSIHAIYGFPWFLPLSAGLGCQWVSPTITGSNKINLKPTFNAFIAVDIPILNFKTVKFVR